MTLRLLSEKRLLAYARLLLVAMGAVVAFDILFRHGWRGGLGQILGIDFIIFYAGGFLYRFDPAQLYNFSAQLQLERQWVYPTALPASGPFSNPPFTAWAYSGLTHLSLSSAFVLWCVAGVLATMVGVHLGIRYLADRSLVQSGLSRLRLTLLVFASYPFVEGMLAGQSHTLTFLLTTATAAATLRERPWLAGILAALLTYKPQLPLGFLLAWILWKQWRSLVAFVAVESALVGWVVLSKGLWLFDAYRRTASDIVGLVTVRGWPVGLAATPYALFRTIPVSRIAAHADWLDLVVGLAFAGWLIVVAARARARSDAALQRFAVALAVILPLFAAPYLLLHDLLILIPALLLAYSATEHERFVRLSLYVFVGTLVLPLAGQSIHVAMLPLLTLYTGFALFETWRSRWSATRHQAQLTAVTGGGDRH